MELSLSDVADESNMGMDIESAAAGCRFPRRHSVNKSKKLCAKEERNASIKRVSLILQKAENQRTSEESQMLTQCSEAVEEVQLRWKKRDEAKRRQEEFEEPMEVLKEKCQILAQAIAQSQHLVCYTGAGISTAARIPDYRGPNGIWTRLQQGKEIGNHDLSLAEPTFTHMALSQLYHHNILKYIVSQNCDGLHLRSGLPRNALSELHGNMYVEVCKSCKPTREYWRLFDVTENTARYSHKTMRRCYVCNEPLVDTIVHFGERGILQWPLNWSGATKNSAKATTILCLGSSLKVLKRYPWLWQMDKPAKKRPNLYIVNLQWTPKDDCANIKIHGKCDEVMRIVMSFLGISVSTYDRFKDPIFYHATPLCDEELHTTTQPFLKSSDLNYSEISENEEKCESLKKEDDVSLHSVELENHQSVSTNCDITCNTRTTHTDNSINNDVSVHLNNSDTSIKEEHLNNPRKCNFSIDSILQDDTILEQEEEDKKENQPEEIYNNLEISTRSNILTNGLILPQNYHAFIAYCRLTNAFLLQNPHLSYQDMWYYPYQTSFLYSGLHSIINNHHHPLPHLNNSNSNNHNKLLLSTVNAKSLDNNKIVKAENSLSNPNAESVPCKFCSREFKSVSCLFYNKRDPSFSKQESEDKKPLICLCCDYFTEDEDDENVLGKKEKSEPDDMETNSEKEHIKVKIQAGWFGKGYRKIKRTKKK